MVLAHHGMFIRTPEFLGGTGRESLDGDLPLKANLFVLWKQEPPFVPQVANASWNAAAGPVVVANCQLHFREHPLVFHLHLDLVQITVLKLPSDAQQNKQHHEAACNCKRFCGKGTGKKQGYGEHSQA